MNLKKLNKKIKEIEYVNLNIFGYYIETLNESYIVSVIDEGHDELAFLHKQYQSGKIMQIPIHCKRDLDISPKEFVNEFNKQNEESLKKFYDEKDKSIEKLGYKKNNEGFFQIIKNN